MAALGAPFAIDGEGRFRVTARMLLATLRVRPELHRVGAIVVGAGGCRMLAADAGRSTRDVWDWVVAHAEDLVRDEPQLAALVVPTVGGTILPTPWFDDIERYELNVWVVDRGGRIERSLIDCCAVEGSLRAGRPRAGDGSPSPLDSVAALLAGLLGDGPTRPATSLRLAA